MPRARPLIASLTASLLAASGTAGHALTWGGEHPFLAGLEASTTTLTLHPFRRGFSLVAPGQSPEDFVTRALRANMSNPLLGLSLQSPVGAFGLTTGTRSLDYGFHVAGVPVCRAQARAHVRVNGETMILGTVPQVDANEPAPPARASDWPDVSLAVRVAAAALEAASDVELKSSTRCFHVKNGHLLHAYDMLLSVDGLPWTALADGYEVFALARGYFDVDGTAKVHPNNVLNDEPVEVKLKGLAGDGTLSSEYIKTVIPSGIATAKEASNVFEYTPLKDPRYDEAAVYYYAQRHFEFVQSLGFQWYGPKPLLVRLHVKPDGRSNNALFVPATSITGNPSISIDDGDGVELQHLGNDADVVSHEFGHHVVYQTLRSTEGQSLVLHEGLADFFAFARSGDACLGESICPKESAACVIPARCLRSGDQIELVYEDPLWQHWSGGRNRLGHLHGQLISGMLWDLRKSSEVPAEDLGKLVMKAVSYFKSNSGFRDLMLALFLADRDLFEGKYFEAIYAAGEARGLGEFFDDVAEDGSALPEPTGGGGLNGGGTPGDATTPSKVTKKEDKGDENPLRCGVVGGVMHADAASILVITLPLLLGLGAAAARPALARAPGRRKKQSK